MEVGWINVSGAPASGQVNGSVVGQTGGPGSATVPLSGFFVTVQACPLSPSPPGLPAPGCTYGSVNQTGFFNFSVTLGWDILSAQSTTYQGNWTWIDVTGNNTTGVIELAPKAAFIGQVDTPDGQGIYSAVVSACPVGSPSLCYPLGTTNSAGQFNGSVPGGPIPWGTYLVMASSSGYATSWTYANSTPGRLTFVPTFTLPIIGSTAHAPGVVPAANGSIGAWVDGRLADSITGFGVGNAQLIECSILTSACGGNLYTDTAGGTFNASVLLGQYYLQVSAPGYPITNVYVNATSANVVHLGTIDLVHYPWVHGRLLVGPWASIADSDGLGAALAVKGCPPVATTFVCGPSVDTNSGGFFNVSVPASGSSQVEYIGRGAPTWGSPGGGYQPGGINVAATQTYVNLPISGLTAPAAGIYGSITGRLADGSTWNATLGAATQACEFCIITTSAVGSPTVSYFPTQTGGGGNYTVFAPSDQLYTDLTGSDIAFWLANESVSGTVPAGAALSAPVLNLPHYGWISLEAIDSTTSKAIPYFAATATVYVPANGSSFVTNGLSRDDGFLNLSAPLGASVTVNVTALGYSWAARTTPVVQSRTHDLGTVSLVPGATTGVWFRSLELNTVNATPFETVVDAQTHQPLPGVSVSTTTALAATETTVFTNGLGQFLSFSPPQGTTGLYARQTGYEPWVFHWVTANVSTVTVQSINMTGDGIVAGRVVAEPGATPVYNTEVDVCPVSTSCSNYGLTNATGYFWVVGPPGADTVSVVSDNFLTNYTVSVSVTTDTWTWVGAVPIFEFATITGDVRGLPVGNLLTDANVSVCSPFGAPGTTCGTVVPTDGNGSFLIPTPPGVYVLEFQAPGYNATFLAIDPLPAQNLSVGTIYLFQDGEILGRVISAVTGAPIANATVYACAETVAGLCSAFEQTDVAGAFALTAPPGLDLLTTTAPAYFDNYTSVFVPTGGSTAPLALDLLPLSVAIPESVEGTVVDANRSNAPIPGAFVAASEGGVAVASTSTDAAGGFTLDIDWGTYYLVASAPGFAPMKEVFVVHANLTGLKFALATMTYTVTGTVTDALTGAPLDAIAISENSTRVGLSTPTGMYSLQLANGTYDLVAASTPGTAEAYASLTFSVDVAGHNVLRNFELTESSGAVTGVVVDGDSGLPVPDASVSVFGSGSTTRIALVGVSSSGAFSVALAPGSYQLNISAPGYDSASVAVEVPVTTGPLTVVLAPATTPGSLATVVPLPILLGAILGVLVAVIAVVVWRRRQPPPPRPLPGGGSRTLRSLRPRRSTRDGDPVLRDDQVGAHDAVERAAELRALDQVRGARRDVRHVEREGVRPPRDGVDPDAERGDVERVDDVRRGDIDLDGRIRRGPEVSPGDRPGRWVVRGVEARAVDRVAELPVPLVAVHVHVLVGVRRQRVDLDQEDRRPDRHERDQRDGGEGPDDLELVNHTFAPRSPGRGSARPRRSRREGHGRSHHRDHEDRVDERDRLLVVGLLSERRRRERQRERRSHGGPTRPHRGPYPHGSSEEPRYIIPAYVRAATAVRRGERRPPAKIRTEAL